MSSKCARRVKRHEKPMLQFHDVRRSLEGTRNTFNPDATPDNTGNGLKYYKAKMHQLNSSKHLALDTF